MTKLIRHYSMAKTRKELAEYVINCANKDCYRTEFGKGYNIRVRYPDGITEVAG